MTPATTVGNWHNEFLKWAPPSQPGVAPMMSRVTHEWGLPPKGAKAKKRKKVSPGDALFDRRLDLLDKWHHRGGVAIMGYELFCALAGQDDKRAKSKASGGASGEAAAVGRRTGLTLSELLWRVGPDVAVCDEGHKLKNLKGAKHLALSKLRTARRVLLSGTPIQNNLLELFAVVQWARPHALGTAQTFKTRFVEDIEAGQHGDADQLQIKRCKARMAVLHRDLAPYMHRRKASLLARHLPPKHEVVVYVKMSPLQASLYR